MSNRLICFFTSVVLAGCASNVDKQPEKVVSDTIIEPAPAKSETTEPVQPVVFGYARLEDPLYYENLRNGKLKGDVVKVVFTHGCEGDS